MSNGTARPARSSGARVAVLSDIHANLPALAAALHRADRVAGRVLVAGDVVGHGPHPAEVVRLLRQRGVEAIRGNVDRKVLLRAERGGDGGTLRPGSRNLDWTAAQLGDDEVTWLRELPTQRRTCVDGRELFLVHGSPLSDSDGIFPSVTRRALEARMGSDRPAALVAGHTHIPFARRMRGILLVNCGSVGRPYDGDPRGSFAVLDLSSARPTARIVRFAYDLEAVAGDARSRDVPGVDPRVWSLGVKKVAE